MWRKQLLPFIDHICDILRFVDLAIIHHDDGTGPGELIHLVQEAENESFEPLCIVGTFNDIQRDDPVEGQCWEN